MLLKGENCFFCAKLPAFPGPRGGGGLEGIYIELTGTFTEVELHLQTCDSWYLIHLCNYILDLGISSKA